MKFQSLYYTLVASLALGYNYGHHRPLTPRDYNNRIYYAVELEPGTNPEAFLDSRGSDWRFEQPLGSLENHYLYSVEKNSESADLVHGIRDKPIEQTLKEQSNISLNKRSERLLYKRDLQNNGVASLQVLGKKKLYKRAPPVHPVDSALIPLENAIQDLGLNDPIFREQWHLINYMEPGNDLNITDVWRQGFTGKKALSVAVVDDGVDLDHKDLKANYFAEGSYDFNDQRPDPRPELDDDRHGTRCAGEIAAVKNDVCGVGVAYDGKVSGIRILSGPISEADEALALNYGMDKNGIYSCSWGPPDNGMAVAEPGMVVRKAILNGIQNGRDKKGSIFVFASGNGGLYGDNCNFDGYTNSIYSITVAALDRKGFHPEYSESCSANMVVTFSSGSNDFIHTTDFHGKCTDHHGGTSAAAPIAAGVFSLVLEARPDLSWRDVQYLAMDTAVPVNEHEEGWQKTFVGKKYHHKYGYGKIDAYGIIEKAKQWKLVKPQAWHFHEKKEAKLPINYHSEDEDACAISTVEITKEELVKSNFERVEHVNVFMDVDHDHRGAMSARLISPEGVVSNVLEPRFQDSSSEGLVGWTVMSVAHWGEPGHGNWTFKVCNKKQQGARGQLNSWRLKLWGESKDASKAMLLPIPKDSDPDIDHRPTSVATIKPTEPAIHQPSRPVKPVSSLSASKSHHEHSSATSKPSSTKGGSKTKPTSSSSTPVEEETKPATTTGSDSNKTWSMIPTFGLSSHTLAWIYGSFLLILGFVFCISIYICLSKRKYDNRSKTYKQQPAMSSMEFDLIPARGDDSDFSEDEDEDEESRFFKDTPSTGLSRSGEQQQRNTDSPGVFSPRDSEEVNANVNTRNDSAGKKARTLYDSQEQGQGESSKRNSDDAFRVDDGDDEVDDKSSLLK